MLINLHIPIHSLLNTLSFRALRPGKKSVILHPKNRYIFKSVNNISECVKIVNNYRFQNTIIDIRILEWLTNLYVHHP